MRRVGFIYFVRPVGMLGPIKIGFSTVPESRLLSLAVWSPFPLEIVATAPGTFRLEMKIHNCFAHLHLHREWFSPSRELVAAIDAIRDGKPLEDVIDLASPTGSIRSQRAVRNKSRTECAKVRASYAHRLRHLVNRESAKRGERLSTPRMADEIIDVSRRESRHFSVDERSYLDSILADPLNHLIAISIKYRAATPIPALSSERAA